MRLSMPEVFPRPVGTSCLVPIGREWELLSPELNGMGVSMHRLLVIEEDAEVRRHLREALEAEGYCVLIAADGPEGLCLFREDPADLVLLNLSISGMDSVDLIRQFHRLSRTSKIIAMSGGIENWQFLTVSSFLGNHMMLQKPFSRQRLLEVVRTQLLSSR